MASEIINFTKESLTALPSATKGFDTYRDKQERGLIITVTAKGVKTFYLLRKIEGKSYRIKIGRFPDLNSKEARELAIGYKNQIAKGVTNKADLKPGIDLDSVQPPDISKEQYAKEYKNLYNIPDFNPAKVDKADIGGNIEQVQKASKGGIKFLKGKGKSYGYETYELLDTVNPELPNAGMSPSQYYIKMFNDVTGQNIGK